MRYLSLGLTQQVRDEMWYIHTVWRNDFCKIWPIPVKAGTCFFYNLSQYIAKPDHLLEQEHAQWHDWNQSLSEWCAWMKCLAQCFGSGGSHTILSVLIPVTVVFTVPKHKILKARIISSPNSANPIDFLGLCSLHIFSISFLRIEMVPFLSFSPRCLI